MAYTLRYGPALCFLTPNLADSRQQLLLVVQGEEFRLEEDVSTTYREMAERLARDPAGQTFVFELMIRLFFVHVLGVQPESVGWRRVEARLKPARYHDGVAADFYGWSVVGPIAAAFGAVEAQGRGSLHPHILVWLLLDSLQVVLDMLMRDPATFKARVSLWMRELIAAVVSVQHSSVADFPWLLHQGAGEFVAPLPFGPNERKRSCANGVRESATADELGLDPETCPDSRELYYCRPDREGCDDQWPAAVRAELPLRNDVGEVVERDEWTAEFAATTRNMRSRPISASASARMPDYRVGQADIDELQRALPSDEFIRELFQDARELVIGCAIHVCSSSCFKYHSRGASHICQHNFYHLVNLWDEDGNEARQQRRRCKPLRACVGIFRDTRYGMAGRIITFQAHPFECVTNYWAKVSMRCNMDVQDLRRVLPPMLWMRPEELEPAVHEDDDVRRHGPYPQRYPDISLGSQANWGWFRHLGTTEHRRHTLLAFTDWAGILQELASRGDTGGQDTPASVQGGSVGYGRVSSCAVV